MMSHTYPAVTVDLVIFTLIEDGLAILLIKRGIQPYRHKWALPGGFIHPNESLEAAARRELKEETGVLAPAYLEQLYTFGQPDRDPRGRVISVAHCALISPVERLRATTDAADARWWPIIKLPALAFDHQAIVKLGIDRLCSKLAYSTIAQPLLPPKFTLTQLQSVYETILQQTLDKRNFRKKLLGLEVIVPTKHKTDNLAHRPATLYRFKHQQTKFFRPLLF